ncbi:MAG: HD domain-containing protein [Prochlorotrichaceae cyanobacterium]|jgi:exopolyphosphatase/guanosine-5'-triphosphate,3'-diphosphate pyrophosphatase
MAEWKAEHILAAIDVGTNSVHMVVVRIEPYLPSFSIVAAEKETVRLGERCPKTGDLTEEAMFRSISALKRFKTRAESLRAESILAVATSATREAPNGREFLKEVQKHLGLTIDLISGDEEARRIYLGVLSAMEFHEHPHVIIDIGGGSTEMILGSGQEPRCLNSTKVGAVRLSREMVTTDPISDAEFIQLQSYLRGVLERPVDDILSHRKPEETIKLVGTSGTIETVAMMQASQQLGTIPDPLQGYKIHLADLQNLIEILRRSTMKERSQIAGLSERRAEIILPGALILQEAMTLLGQDTLTVCQRALREGVIVDWMLSHGLIEDRLRYQGSVRKRSVLSTAKKYHVNLPYSDRVAQFALSVFDQLRSVLHEWGDEERELLWAAAILHNAGHFISHSAHHKHSYYLIRNSNLLGYTETEIEAIANLARYHRKSGPKSRHENYRNLANKQLRQMVDQLSPILRLAVALDRRQLGALQAVNCHYNDQLKTLTLELVPSHPEDDCALELWNLREKKAEFEKVFGVTVEPILRDRSV